MLFFEQKHNNSERAAKILTNDDNRQSDDITHVLTMQPDTILLAKRAVLNWVIDAQIPSFVSLSKR